ncbi:MAG: YceI family protein [Caldilineaceae bacterium]|nr:YceI family protein [Caldilineaceae bacterium]
MRKYRHFYFVGLLALLLLLPAACAVPTVAPAATSDADVGAPAAEDTGNADAITFRIVPEESEARFSIDEVLLGNDQTVVGATQDISGEISVNPARPAESHIGPIEINADALVTDNERRNTAIRRFILQTPDHPTITFTPTSLGDMPDSVGVGDVLTLQVTGDLQIREIVNPVTFDLTVEVVSASEIVGNAQAVIERSAFELTIPSVPSVTFVSEEVDLALDFTARSD